MTADDLINFRNGVIDSCSHLMEGFTPADRWAIETAIAQNIHTLGWEWLEGAGPREKVKASELGTHHHAPEPITTASIKAMREVPFNPTWKQDEHWEG